MGYPVPFKWTKSMKNATHTRALTLKTDLEIARDPRNAVTSMSFNWIQLKPIGFYEIASLRLSELWVVNCNWWLLALGHSFNWYRRPHSHPRTSNDNKSNEKETSPSFDELVRGNCTLAFSLLRRDRRIERLRKMVSPSSHPIQLNGESIELHSIYF